MGSHIGQPAAEVAAFLRSLVVLSPSDHDNPVAEVSILQQLGQVNEPDVAGSIASDDEVSFNASDALERCITMHLGKDPVRVRIPRPHRLVHRTESAIEHYATTCPW